MNEHGIRHLPVLHGGALVGLVSQRDIQLLESLQGVESTEVTVEEAMSQDVLTAKPRESVQAVSGRMARRKAGSAVVVEKGRVLGIFTTIDALKVLASSGGRPSKRATRPKAKVGRD